MKKSKFALYLGLIALLSWQCSDEDSQSNVSGSAVKGTVATATVTVYKYDGTGTRGEVIATTSTTQSGEFNVSVNYAGAVEVVVTGGSYKDEATGQGVSLNAKELRTIVSINGSSTVGVTALTTIAAGYIDEHAHDGLAQAIESASKGIAKALKLEGIDITSVVPADLSTAASATASAQALKYGAVQAGLSEFIRSRGLTPEKLLDAIHDMSEDFKDGVFDGKNGSTALNFALSITPQEAVIGLDMAMNSFLNSDKNKSGKGLSMIFGG